jgi:hypothetical protein
MSPIVEVGEYYSQVSAYFPLFNPIIVLVNQITSDFPFVKVTSISNG